MLIFIFAQKVALGTIPNNLTQNLYFTSLFAIRLLEIALPWQQIPDDQKLFKRVCYKLIRKVTKFQLPTPNSS